jgi:hypothetical protein
MIYHRPRGVGSERQLFSLPLLENVSLPLSMAPEPALALALQAKKKWCLVHPLLAPDSLGLKPCLSGSSSFSLSLLSLVIAGWRVCSP